MSYNHERFISYFLPTDSEELVPTVAPKDIEDFESNAEQNGLEPVYAFRTIARPVIKELVRVMGQHPFFPRQGDLAGPLVDSSVIPPVQVPGIRIYRPDFPLRSDKEQGYT